MTPKQEEQSVIEISLETFCARVRDRSIKRWKPEEREAVRVLILREHRTHVRECLSCRLSDGDRCEFAQAQMRFLGLTKKGTG